MAQSSVGVLEPDCIMLAYLNDVKLRALYVKTIDSDPGLASSPGADPCLTS